MPRGVNTIIEIDPVNSHTANQRNEYKSRRVKAMSDDEVMGKIYRNFDSPFHAYTDKSIIINFQNETKSIVSGNPDFVNPVNMTYSEGALENSHYESDSVKADDSPHPKGPNIQVNEEDIRADNGSITRQSMGNEDGTIGKRLIDISSDGYGTYEGEGTRDPKSLIVKNPFSSNNMESSREKIANYFTTYHYKGEEYNQSNKEAMGDSTPAI